MSQNIGKIDRLLRLAIAALFAFIILTGTAKALIATILAIAAIYLGATALIGHCPAYKAMDVDSA